MSSTGPAAPPPARLGGGTLALYAITVFAWGVSWIALRAQVGVVAPEVSVFWRFLIASAAMLAWVGWRGLPMRFDLATHRLFALLGLLLFSTNFTLFYYGGLTIPSGLLAVVFSLASVINMLLGAALLRQRIEARVALAGALGFLGVGLMFLPELRSVQPGVGVGLLLCLAGTFSFCTGNIVSARLQGRAVPVLSANAWGMIYGAAFLGLVSLVRGHAFIIEPTARYIGGLVFLAIVSSVIAFASYLTLLGRIGAARAGYATVLFPIVALALSTVLEGYVWTPLAAIGLLFALGGNVLMLTRSPAR